MQIGLFSVVAASSFFTVSPGSVFGYWLPVLMVVTLLLVILNNRRTDRHGIGMKRQSEPPLQ